MHDLDAINADQLVTATDWLLHRGPRRRRPPVTPSTYDLQYAPTVFVRRQPARRRGSVAVVAAGLVAAYASLAVAVACVLA